MLDRQTEFTAHWPRLVKRRRALLESIPPRNSQQQLIEADERRGGGSVCPTGAQNRKGVTLQAQEVDLAHAEKARIVRPMRRVTTDAAFRLHRDVFIYKGPLLVGVTLRTNCISTGKSSDLPQCGCAMNVVAVAAVDEAFIHAVVIGLGEIRFGRSMTSIAEVGLSPGQQMLRLLGIMRRMAIDAAYVIVVV